MLKILKLNKNNAMQEVTVEGTEKTIDRDAWGPWATLGFGFVIGIAFLISQMLVMIVFVVAKLSSETNFEASRLDAFDVSQLTAYLATNGLVLAVCTYASTVVCVLLILLFIKLRKGPTIAEYLSLKPVSTKMLVRLLGLCAGIIMLMDGVGFLIGRPIVPQFMIDIYSTKGWPPIFWTALVIAAPISEEIFFRGFLLEGFRRSRIGNAGAILVTALIWASIHLQYGVYEIVMLFFFGVLLGIVRLKTGSLWSCLFIHSVINLAATIEVALCVNGIIG